MSASCLLHRMEYDYLSDVPVLTLDVTEEFKADPTKCADMIEKVSGENVLLIRDGSSTVTMF